MQTPINGDCKIFRRLNANSTNIATEVLVEISVPLPINDGMWQCRYTISVGSSVLIEKLIVGADGVEAIVGCLKRIEAELEFHPKFADLEIEQPIDGVQGFGFWQIMKI